MPQQSIGRQILQKLREGQKAKIQEKRFGFRAIPCVHELEVIEPCTGCHGDGRSVRGCKLHDKCTRMYVNANAHCCALCGDYAPGQEKWEWISLKALMTDVVRMAGYLPLDICGVGGVPRSGMMPASILSCILHVPLWEVGEHGDPIVLRSGNRGRGLKAEGKLLVVDDSVYAGCARERVRKALAGRPHYYAALYVRHGQESQVDYYGRLVSSLHVLEWNWPTNGGIRGWYKHSGGRFGFGSDLDGIIVHTGTVAEYREQHTWFPVCTQNTAHRNRSPQRERHRTESQLRSIGCQWEKPPCLPDHVTLTVESAADFKAKCVTESNLELFLSRAHIKRHGYSL